jgi:molybdenum cofactor guanylyltransferase
MPNETAAIVLAGGRSTRLGRDKASEPLLGVPMLQRVIDRLAGLTDEIVVVGRRDQDLSWARGEHLRIVEDLYPDAGPLGGIYTGLTAIEEPLAIAVACDMPLLQPALLAALIRLGHKHELVVPVNDGLPQPLCAVYRKACAGPIQTQISKGNLKLTGVVESLGAHYVEPEEWRIFDPDGLSFQNLNSEAGLRGAEVLLAPSQAQKT